MLFEIIPEYFMSWKYLNSVLAPSKVRVIFFLGMRSLEMRSLSVVIPPVDIGDSFVPASEIELFDVLVKPLLEIVQGIEIGRP